MRILLFCLITTMYSMLGGQFSSSLISAQLSTDCHFFPTKKYNVVWVRGVPFEFVERLYELFISLF